MLEKWDFIFYSKHPLLVPRTQVRDQGYMCFFVIEGHLVTISAKLVSFSLSCF